MHYLDYGEYKQALELYGKSLDISEKIGDLDGMCNTLGEIGLIWKNVGDNEKALMYYKKSLEIALKINNNKSASTTLHNIGTIYFLSGRFDEAMENYQKSLAIKEKIGEIVGAADSYHQMGILYNEMKEFPTALECSLRAYLLFSQIQSPKAFRAYQDILTARSELSDTEFKEILKKYDIPPDAFDNPQ
jgi:tetratricopeptide (TPR) repeat protein